MLFSASNLQANKLGTILQVVEMNMGAYVRSRLICIWHTAPLIFPPLLAVPTGTRCGNRCAFSLTECTINCNKLFVFGVTFRSNISVSLYNTVIILLYFCAIKCSKCCINMACCLAITLLLTKYLTSAEMLVRAAGCAVKHLFSCSCASVSSLSSLSLLLASPKRCIHNVTLFHFQFPGNLVANTLSGRIYAWHGKNFPFFQ